MAKISKYEIKRNAYNGGLCAFPTINGKQYFFDLAYTMDHGNECMGFPAEDGQVTDWGEVYQKTGMSITEENLKECIKEFAAKQK